MSNTQRPAARKASKSADKRAAEALDEAAHSLRVDGQVYTLNPNDVSGSTDRKLRQACGLTVMSILSELEAKPGVDTIAAFMFAAGVADGGECSEEEFERVLDSISYATAVELVEDAPEDGSPEA